VQTQTMIIRRLLKFGIKWGNFTLLQNEITINILINNKNITVEVMSQVYSKCSQSLSELLKTIQFIKEYQDPFETFLIKHNETAKVKYYDCVNDLDLASIAYKENVALDFIIGEENSLIQSAIRKFEENSGLTT
jgi:hypothetical protein